MICSFQNDPITQPRKLQVSAVAQPCCPHWQFEARSRDPNSKKTDPGTRTPFCDTWKQLQEQAGEWSVRTEAAEGSERLESGSRFIPSVSEKRLARAARREKDPRAKLRLIACRDRKRNRSIRRIARDLGVAHSTVRNWPVRMRDWRLRGRFNRKSGGRKAVFGFPHALAHLRRINTAYGRLAC
jgi:hypothetical protein